MMPQEIIVCLEKSKRLPFDKSVDKLQDGAYIKRLQGLFCVLQFFSDLDVLGAVFLTGAAFGAVIHGVITGLRLRRRLGWRRSLV